MKLIQLQYFLTIAECKSITKAAEKLFVSQPAVTKQMNQLEEELGTKLMQRTTAGIELTEIGKEFAKDVRAVLRDLDKAVTKAVNAGNKTADVLRIGCFDGAVIEDFLPDLYSYLGNKAPELEVKLGRKSVIENRRALAEDSIDILIELFFPTLPDDDFLADCETQTLVIRHGALIYSERSPLAKKKKLELKDFEKETFLGLTGSEEHTLRKANFDALTRLGFDASHVEEVDNFVTLISNIRMGEGYSILSEGAKDAFADLRAFRLPKDFDIEVIAAWKKSNRFVSELMKDYKHRKNRTLKDNEYGNESN